MLLVKAQGIRDCSMFTPKINVCITCLLSSTQGLQKRDREIVRMRGGGQQQEKCFLGTAVQLQYELTAIVKTYTRPEQTQAR